VTPLVVALAAPLRRELGAFQNAALPGSPAMLASMLRGIALLAMLALLVVQVNAVRHLYYDPSFARDDYRGIAQHIKREGRDGDAVLLSAPNQWEVFTYYYRESLPVYPAPYRPTEAAAADWVAEILREHTGGRLFVLYWGDQESDPSRRIERALANSAYKAGEAWIDTVRLAHYGTAQPVTVPYVDVEATVGESVVLDGYQLPAKTYRGGDIVPLTLTWRAEATPKTPMKVFVHLVDQAGELVAQVDMEPQAGFAPTTTWTPGARIVDRYGISLPSDLPAGVYTVLVGMYRFDGQRLTISHAGAVVGDALLLAELAVR
jgi:hypothetical protein